MISEIQSPACTKFLKAQYLLQLINWNVKWQKKLFFKYIKISTRFNTTATSTVQTCTEKEYHR